MGKTIMMQGTASGVGKSTLVTGLCRVLMQDGLRVAPFKAQNMSSNAHHLPDGRQMARSQAIEAFACGIEPHSDMNPVLLKPKEMAGSEVILCGKSIGFMKDFEYNELKEKISKEVIASYNRLASEYDVVVVEGAGSPVELNLKENDVVNMGFASRTDCPVVLVSDINRGGAFASVYGTLMLLTESERQLVKGIVINKFQGLAEYFKSGADILENITQKPLLGIIPYCNINIEDEDSLTEGKEVKTKASLKKKLTGKLSYREYMDIEFDTLADVLRKNLNISEIYKILEGEL